MNNQLAKIVTESYLEQTKAQVILTNFQNYFDIASEWDAKVSSLNVTDVSQVAEMKMAREARLFLKAKRIDVENTRKQLKEQSLREGQTIDHIAGILKNLIIPIEEKAAKAPDKEKLKAWVDSFAIGETPATSDIFNPTKKVIEEKFKAFKTWSITQIENI